VVLVPAYDQTFSSSNFAPMAWDCSDLAKAKSLLDLSMLVAATPAGAVSFLEALPWLLSVPLFERQGKP
jgi:hypothetical protein